MGNNERILDLCRKFVGFFVTLSEYMNFKELTKEPHIAGQRRDNELTKLIQKAWMDMSFDHVELAEFDFYLSWPNQVNCS